MGACGSRGVLERSAVTLSVGAFSSLERLRNTRPKGTGSIADPPRRPAGNDPATARVLAGVRADDTGVTYSLGGTGPGAQSSLGEEPIHARTVR